MRECRLDLRDLGEGGGAYVLVLRLSGGGRRIRVGSLGLLEFAPGCYCYVGSARAGLRARLARHLRVGGKRKRWHVDYLRPRTAAAGVFVWDGTEADEAALSNAVGELADRSVAAFGAGDSPCGSHLHYFARDPTDALRRLQPQVHPKNGDGPVGPSPVSARCGQVRKPA